MYGDYILPEPPLEPPEPKIVGTCECCKEDICEGDDIVEFDGTEYHRECFDDIAVSILFNRYGAMARVAEGVSR